MAEVLCVYREVEVLKKAPAKAKRRGVAIVSCDEKPGSAHAAAQLSRASSGQTPPDILNSPPSKRID
jgi:hypothetical protein